MKLKIKTLNHIKKSGNNTNISDVFLCVTWCNSEEIVHNSSDSKLFKKDLLTNESTEIVSYPENVYPTSIHLFPKNQSTKTKQSNDAILMTTADGRFCFITQNGRIEKFITAHRGACLCCEWNPDGAGFLTAGEDGLVKIWSRNGLARSTVVNANVPIYCATWGPSGFSIAHGQTNFIDINYLQGNHKAIQWKAHDSTILSIKWNLNNNLILTGSEDGTFKTWDSYGQLLSNSVRHDTPIITVCWAPAGDVFAIAGYNFLRLCDYSGWSHCMERPTTGSIHSLVWSTDGTQIAATCANGQILIAHIIERQLEWRHFTCTLTKRKTIIVKDILNDTVDQLDYPNNIIQIEFGYDHLIAVSTKQCFVHPSSSWNTPIVVELKDGALFTILMSERNFCLVEKSAVNIYTYQGRLLASPRWGSMRPETLSKNEISLGTDSFAVIDQNELKSIHIFELPTGLVVKSSGDYLMGTFNHTMQISAISLSQCGLSTERILAFLDFNKDLHILTIREQKLKSHKIAVQVIDMIWSEEALILVALKDGKLSIFGCPQNTQYLSITTINREVSDLGKNPKLLLVEEGKVTVRRGDGSIVHIPVSPFPFQLSKHILGNQWTKAIKLCRLIKDDILWACLAVHAWNYRELDIAEEAFAIIKQPQQVEYIQKLKYPELDSHILFK